MEIIAVYYPTDDTKNNNEVEGCIFDTEIYGHLVSLHGIKEANIISLIPMRVKGNTYAECKADLQNKAIEWSYSSGAANWYYSELTEIQAFFERNGKRYGLLREFRENGII